jgi:phosphoribosylformylglycinamidine cyclo-ligase
LLPRPATMQAGELLIGLPSSGAHTNGYSLIRKLTAHLTHEGYEQPLTETSTLGEALLAPHRSYLPAVRQLQAENIPLKGMAHITGGGFIENIPRVLPSHLSAEIQLGRWQIPALFDMLLESAEMERAEAYRVFNMGIGMVLIVEPLYSQPIQTLLPDAVVIGQLVEGNQSVILREGTP